MALREFIAYGFAVLPEVIDIIGRNLQKSREMDKTTGGPTTTTGAWFKPSDDDRRLDEASSVRALEEVEDGEMFDEFVVEFSDITYTIDHPLVATLIRHKAFDTIDDGRKRELGPIKIVGFDIQSRHPLLNEISGKSDSKNALRSYSSNKVTGVLTLLSLTCVALMVGGVTLVRGRFRSTYKPQLGEAPDLEESDQEMRAEESRNVGLTGYERVRSEA